MIDNKIKEAKTILIGAGAGLSTSAGFIYSGERFDYYFSDFINKYGFTDMYTGGFYPFDTLEEYWAYWSRYIYINRYMDAPLPVYDDLYDIVKDKDYFVLTTNVDHCFQKAGFDKNRIFYTQGDYGLFQCSDPCHNSTYDNEEIIKKMVLSQGFKIIDGELVKEGNIEMEVPTELIPYCPKCGKPMTMNLRADSTFVEDEGWHQAATRYQKFIEKHQDMVLLELGVGFNTPGIIKYPFWKMTSIYSDTYYICINKGQAYVPDDIKHRAICINDDIGEVIHDMRETCYE